MTQRAFVRRLLTTTLFCAAAGITTPAFAQDQQPQGPQQPQQPGTGPVEGAQETPASANGQQPEDSGGTILVTGTRIRSPNLESASPITVVNNQDVTLTGTTRAEDLLNSLPQVFAAQGSNVSNGATGTATVSLRGLGAERNLVLVNGRRLVPGDPGSSAADINMIPSALIERVDILTGGASSVYGADAVSGVVNFILNSNFEGVRLDSQYSFYQHSNSTNNDVIRALNARQFGFPGGSVADGGTIDATLAFGASFADGRGHITAYAGYRSIKPVLQGNRDYSACSLTGATQAAVTAGGSRYTCGGSATSANGSFIIYDSGGNPANFTSTFFQIGPNRTFIPGSTAYNFGPLNYFQRPDERYTAGLFANYEITPGVEAYLEFMFMDDRSVAQIAPSGDFGNTFSLNCNNPLLSAQQRSIVCDTENLLVSPLASDAFFVVGNAAAENAARRQRNIGEPLLGLTPFNFIDPTTGTTYQRGFAQILRRNVEGAPRRDDLQHTEFRTVAGLRGQIDPVWSYDAYVLYGRTNFAETYFNDFSVTRLTRALDVVDDPRVAGIQPICRSVLDGSDPNCVPYDILANGAVTPAAVAYLATPGFQRGVNEETVVSASLSGDLSNYGLKFPWASEGVGTAIGVEYRKEELDFSADTAFQTGDLAGQGAATLPVAGSFEVKEVFGELRIPIVQNGFIQNFTVSGGYRYSDYQNSAGGGFATDTYKVEAELAPIRDIRFRGTYARAVRAPTVQDLFAPNRVVLDGSTDPCAGRVITNSAADAGCRAQGLAVGSSTPLNPASQYNGQIGGNINLTPEIADTYTGGVVIQPRFLPRFALSVDYFNIKINQAIGSIGADTILAQCTATADPFFCSLVRRDASGSLWRSANGFVVDVTQNIGGQSTSGIDINASYSQPIGSLGSLGLNFVGTYLLDLTTDTGVGGANPTFDCTGLYGNICGSPNPEWRHQARLTWNGPEGIGVSLRWRYFSSVTLDAVDPNPNLFNGSASGPAPGGVARPGLARFPSTNYYDLAFTFRVSDSYTFRLGVNNLLDTDPPLTGSQACPAGPCNGNTFAQTYDALGRYIYAGIRLDF